VSGIIAIVTHNLLVLKNVENSPVFLLIKYIKNKTICCNLLCQLWQLPALSERHSTMTDLTGIFSCDDGGTYWVRQVENKVYWFGRNGPPTFSNIFIGTIYIGVSENGIIYNADLFGINFTTIEAIILSHGHMDHCRGLVNVLSKCTNPHTLLFILMLF